MSKYNNEKKYDLEENKERNKKLSNLGIVLIIIGIVLFFAGFFGIMGGNTATFIFAVIGIILSGVGQSLFNTFGKGRMARFNARQTAPVKRDLTNYLLEESKDNINDIFNNKNKGITERACLKCGAINPIDNKYCGNCGNTLK